jgi:hypothetical protein
VFPKVRGSFISSAHADAVISASKTRLPFIGYLTSTPAGSE